MPPAPSTQATPPIIGTADWPMRAARHAGQAPRAPASTSPPALTAIVWIWQCRGDRQPGDLRCLGRAPAHPHFRPVVARGNYGRPGPGNQLCEPERPRAPREPALNSRHRSSPVRTAQGRRSTSRWCVPIGGYTRRLARANRHTAQCALDEYSLIGTAVSRDAVVALKQGTGVALLVTGCRKQPLSGPA